MKLYLENSAGQEIIIECNNWGVEHGVLVILDGIRKLACIKEWNYVGEQPFDDLLAKELDEDGSYVDCAFSKGIVPPPPPPSTSDVNVRIERND